MKFEEWFADKVMSEGYTTKTLAKEAWFASRENLIAVKVLQHWLSFPDLNKYDRWVMEDALHELTGEPKAKGYINIHTGEKIWINHSEKLEDFPELLDPKDYKRCVIGERYEI